MHKIDSTDEYWISPLNEEDIFVDPQKDIIRKFIKKVDSDVEFTIHLAAFALSSE